jgi:hypothetical protein
MDLYDNVDYQYRHTDVDRSVGLKAVSNLLHLSEPPSPDALYDLFFFSGGIGVLNRFAITLPANSTIWTNVVAVLNAWTLEQASSDKSWAKELLWLFIWQEDRLLPLRPAADRFINEQRREFQTESTPANRVLVGHPSDVNDWTVLWGDDTTLNYLGYSQG